MLNAQIISLKHQGKEHEDLTKLKTSQAIALTNPFSLLRNMLSCYFVGEEEKARGNSKSQVSNLKPMHQEEGSSQWRTMKQLKITQEV